MPAFDEGAWVLTNEAYGADGKPYTGPVDPDYCGRAGPEECERWLATQNIQQRITHLPAERFWTLQWREFAVFASVSMLLSLFCLWWIRRRVA